MVVQRMFKVWCFICSGMYMLCAILSVLLLAFWVCKNVSFEFQIEYILSKFKLASKFMHCMLYFIPSSVLICKMLFYKNFKTTLFIVVDIQWLSAKVHKDHNKEIPEYSYWRNSWIVPSHQRWNSCFITSDQGNSIYHMTLLLFSR